MIRREIKVLRLHENDFVLGQDVNLDNFRSSSLQHRQEIYQAELVIGPQGQVFKDRYGLLNP